MVKITEENYVRQMQLGNERALTYFIEQHGWLIKSIVRKRMAAYPDAQGECMNDIFLAVWQSVGRYDKNKAAFLTWVTAVARYQILKFIQNMHQNEMADIDGLELTGASDVKSSIFNADEEKEFRDLLQTLSSEDQEIFMQLFWEERSYEEISESMGMNKDTLYSRISRGKKKLRKNGRWRKHERYL